MHILTLSSLALALGTFTINANTASKDWRPDPFYDWEHRTTCKTSLNNPERKDKEEWLDFDVTVVGYAWDETFALTPDHKWNWNTTANAKDKLLRSGFEGIGFAGRPDKMVFESGEPDDRGFTQFTLEVSIWFSFLFSPPSWRAVC
jgi:hypothetical protein